MDIAPFLVAGLVVGRFKANTEVSFVESSDRVVQGNDAHHEEKHKKAKPVLRLGEAEHRKNLRKPDQKRNGSLTQVRRTIGDRDEPTIKKKDRNNTQERQKRINEELSLLLEFARIEKWKSIVDEKVKRDTLNDADHRQEGLGAVVLNACSKLILRQWFKCELCFHWSARIAYLIPRKEFLVC